MNSIIILELRVHLRDKPPPRERPAGMQEEKQVTHTNTQQEQHHTRHDKNKTATPQHTTRQEEHHKRPHEVRMVLIQS